MTSNEHSFSADRPIETRSEDRLNRAGFAAQIARAINAWRGRDSLVLALYGHWGSGKSSVKAMIVEALGSLPEEYRPEILEFNSWQHAGPSRLGPQFFDEIGRALGKAKDGSAASARRWRLYAARLRLATVVAPGYGALLKTLLAVLAGMGFLRFVDASWASVATTIVTIIAAAALAGLTFAKEATEAVAGFLEAKSASSEQSLEEIKQDLAKLLRQRRRPLLVVVDDLDRLASGDIRLLVQLVKANADLPNLVYLLLADRAIIESALTTRGQGGRQFLEKIVQVGFDIPAIDRAQLDTILFEELNRIVNQPGVDKHFDKERWAEVFRDGVQKYLTTLRNVHRFLGTLDFHVGAFRSGDTFEVNIVDLIAVESLRVFEPALYQELPALKDVLTEKHEDRDRVFGMSVAEAKGRIDAALAVVPESRRTTAIDLLRALFPHTQNLFGGSSYADDFEDRWFREMRVCSKERFGRYFQLSVPQGDISQERIDSLLRLSTRENIREALLVFKAEQVLVRALDILDSYKQEVPLQNVQALSTAIFDIGDDLPEAAPSMFAMGSDMHAVRVVRFALMNEADVSKRDELLEVSIRQTNGLYLPVMRVSIESEAQKKGTREGVVSAECLAKLKAICIQKIEASAASDSLMSHPKFAYIFWRWRDFGGGDGLRRFMEQMLADPARAVKFAVNMPFPGMKKDDHTPDLWHAERMNHFRAFSELADLATLESALRRFDMGTLAEPDKDAVDAYLSGIEEYRSEATARRDATDG